ncbi:hypothetical protein Trydic_g12357 [Trypoxylus dichotomus]
MEHRPMLMHYADDTSLVVVVSSFEAIIDNRSSKANIMLLKANEMNYSELLSLNNYDDDGQLLGLSVDDCLKSNGHICLVCKRIATQEYFTTEESDPMLQLIEEDPNKCLILYQLFIRTDLVEACLNIFRKMSIIADSIFIGNDIMSPLQVNTTKMVSLLRNTQHLNQMDCIIGAVCLTLMPKEDIEAEIDAVVHILGNMMKTSTDRRVSFDVTFSAAYRRLEDIFDNMNRTLIVATSNLVVVTWYPFQDNFNGIAWYKCYNTSNGDYIETLSRNQSLQSINKTNLEMAVYIPHEFLANLAAQSELKGGRDLFIILKLAKENHFLIQRFNTNVYNIISVKIPGFCKKNELPILKILYGDELHFREYGSKYIDESNGLSKTCILATASHFARIRNNTSLIESIKTEYCLRYPIGKTYYPQTPIRFGAYPESFCMNARAEIPYLLCNSTTYAWENQKSIDLKCSNNYTTSMNTMKIYKLATECWNLESFDGVVNAMNSTNLEAIDKKMFYDILSCVEEFIFREYVTTRDYIQKNNASLFDAINMVLELLKDLPIDLMKTTRIHQFLISFMSSMRPEQMMLKADDNYIYQRLQPFSNTVLGIAIYKRGSGSFKYYEVKHLTKDNTTTSLATDQSVEVAIYITNIESAHQFSKDVNCVPSILVTRSTLYPENDTVAIKSRSLVVSACIMYEFTVFLRVIEDEGNWGLNYYTGEGYWFNMTVEGDVTITHIAESRSHSYCESIRSVEVWKYIYSTESSIHTSTGKATANKIDLLSMISMSVNSAESKTGTEEIYNKYSPLLKFFRMIGSTLSVVAVIILFTTALVLKDWRKTRFYTIQLTIILSLQIILFIMEGQVGEMPQAGFFIFYYSILSQFCWMSLIGYVQYMRYIKVFESRRVGVVKSLIIGWLLPAVIIAISILYYHDCLQCNLCYKNKEIFMYFVLIPVGLVVIINLTIYVLAMVNIWSNENGESLASERKFKIRASILLPFLLGITWIFLFALVSPWSWLFVAGLILIHLILPSQALVLCTFVVLLDESTRHQWKARMGGMLKKRM